VSASTYCHAVLIGAFNTVPGELCPLYVHGNGVIDTRPSHLVGVKQEARPTWQSSGGMADRAGHVRGRS
jgi:hypothetical protein